MQLHQEHGDLWSKLRYKNCMVGCHSSLIRPYFYELLSAIEHCHNHGIVHRDLKPENVLLNEQGGHVILIDFGTAKDLIVTDLNGPEFVGTPDYMSPEAVQEGKGDSNSGCDFTADLWSLGVILYQLYAGALPFESQSPYLGFLKIQRGVYVGRNMGVWDDDAWDLIQKLLKVNSKDRIGAGCFNWVPPPIIDGTDAKDMNNGNRRIDEEKEWTEKVENAVAAPSTKQRPIGKILEHGSGYDIIRQHPFLAKHQLLTKTNSHLKSDSDMSSIPQPIPSLQDLAIRATAHFIDQSSLDIDLEDLHPPGDNSSYDALRLKPTDRRRVMHLLDRLHLLREPRIYRRFFLSKQDAQLGRIRPESRDVIGLTQLNDKMGQPRGKNPDEPHPDLQVPASKLVGTSRTRIHHITNPLFSRTINDRCSNNEEERKLYIKQLKESLRLVNRVRPNVVVACGYFDDACRKLLSKISETIPVILHDGSSYFNFWIYGAHCLVIPVKYLQGTSSEELDVTRKREALAWFRMELEQVKTARSHGFVFLDGDARDISQEWMSYIGKRHVLGLIGTYKVPFVSGEVDASHDLFFETQFSVAKLQIDVTAGKVNMDGQENEDDSSISSSDSGKSNDEHVMHIVGRLENGVRCITIGEEDLVWNGEILL
jgi:serine/threonine protein kinase